MKVSKVRGSMLVREWDKTSVSQLELMVYSQYQKLGCFELSSLNCNRPISWTQKIKLIFFHWGTSHCFCFLSATTIQVIYSSQYRFRGVENGFFTNCFCAHHDAVINMTQGPWATELIYFQDFLTLCMGHQLLKSILLKCSVSRASVGAQWQTSRYSRSSYL